MNNKIELLKIKIAEELRKLRAEKDLSLEAVINGINEKNEENMINIGIIQIKAIIVPQIINNAWIPVLILILLISIHIFIDKIKKI